MKVILAVCNTKRYLGLSKYFYFLAKHLIAQGIRVEVIVDCEEGKKKLQEAVGNVPCSVIGPTTRGVISTALWCWNLSQNLKRFHQFDILHTCHVNPFFYLMLSNRKPVVFQPFGNELFTLEEMATGYKKLYYKITQPILRHCGHNCDALAVEGQFQWNEMVRWYDNEDRMFILPEAIDIEYIEKTVEDTWGKLERFPNQVLAVNSLYPYESMDILIEAIRIVKRSIPHIHLVIIGSGPEYKRLNRMIDSYGLRGNVYIFSEIPERVLYRYYAKSSVFVSTSMEENFLMTIMEAEALGCPIISTGQKWLINGNGFIVGRDSVEIAWRIRQILEGGFVEHMGERSKEIVQQYDFKEVVKTVIGIYKTLLKNPISRFYCNRCNEEIFPDTLHTCKDLRK